MPYDIKTISKQYENYNAKNQINTIRVTNFKNLKKNTN